MGGQHLHFGPEPPTDGNPNWIKTVPGRNWFAALRLYGPTQEFFDRAWIKETSPKPEPPRWGKTFCQSVGRST